jgi:hypothetical protein
MPAFVPELQKRFRLTMVDGLPHATVDKVGDVHLLRCCPLCGCTHQILTMDEGSPYTPLCQTFPYLYKAQQTSWHKLYPDVAKFAKLRLTVHNGK